MASPEILVRQAVARNPSNPAYQNNLGNALGALGRREDAVVAFQRDLSLAADDPETPANLAGAHYNLGNVLTDRSASASGDRCPTRSCSLGTVRWTSQWTPFRTPEASPPARPSGRGCPW